jgi:hypothetical protein
VLNLAQDWFLRGLYHSEIQVLILNVLMMHWRRVCGDPVEALGYPSSSDYCNMVRATSLPHDKQFGKSFQKFSEKLLLMQLSLRLICL